MLKSCFPVTRKAPDSPKESCILSKYNIKQHLKSQKNERLVRQRAGFFYFMYRIPYTKYQKPYNFHLSPFTSINKRVIHFFVSNARGGSVAGINRVVFGQGEELCFDAVHQQGEIARGQVGAAYTFGKQHIAREN